MATIRNISPPNYPIAARDYSQQWQDQFTNVLRLFCNSVANAVNAPKIFGSFYDTTTQTNPVANVPRPITLDSVAAAFGTKLGNPTSRVYVTDTGVYNIQFSAQVDKSSGSSAQSIYIWLRINGTDVPYSASEISIKDASSETVAAWNFVTIMQANDYFELVWLSPDTDMQLKAPAATASVPGIPSAIVTVTWVSNIPV